VIDELTEFEFESIPLVVTQTIRVRFVDIGPLPPFKFDEDDEVEE